MRPVRTGFTRTVRLRLVKRLRRLLMEQRGAFHLRHGVQRGKRLAADHKRREIKHVLWRRRGFGRRERGAARALRVFCRQVGHKTGAWAPNDVTSTHALSHQVHDTPLCSSTSSHKQSPWPSSPPAGLMAFQTFPQRLMGFSLGVGRGGQAGWCARTVRAGPNRRGHAHSTRLHKTNHHRHHQRKINQQPTKILN